MSFVRVGPNVRLFVQDINSCGEHTILFIHGWPLMHTTFEYQYDVLPHFGYRCIGIDLRGFGNSDKPWWGYDYDRMSDDIYEIINTLNLRNITLAGHSMGGAIAIRYMARHAGYQVSNLVLMAAAAPSFTPRPGFPYGMARERVDEFIRGLYKDRPRVLSDFGNIFFGQSVTPSFLNWFQGTGLGAAGYSTIKALESLRDEDLRQDIRSIHVPTGIFQGLLDQVCPYPLAVELNKGIPYSTLYRFDQSGHAVYYDELDRFNNTLIHFLKNA